MKGEEAEEEAKMVNEKNETVNVSSSVKSAETNVRVDAGVPV